MTVSLNRLQKVLEARPAILDGPRKLDLTKIKGDISIENVTFGYGPDRPVLRGLNMRFAAGKSTGIVGPTGAGKSTILKLLLRYYDVQSGSIRLDDTDIREYRLNDLRRAIALVPQLTFLFAGTVRENIAYANPSASLDQVRQAARVAESEEFIQALPDGYETEVGEGGYRLSGGQQQRLTIARAVLANKPILFFDEATSAVDHDTEAAIQRSLEEVTANRTTVMVAHRLSMIRHCDHIYVVDDGQVREEGSHAQLVKADGIYASMWRVQTGEVPRTSPSRSRRPRA
jgi:ATP-binding cassette subfamily B protein